MKNAWVVYNKAKDKGVKLSFANALKFAWQVAKKEISLKKEWDRMDEDEEVTFNFWVVPNHVRAYYKLSWMSRYFNSKKNHFIEL